MFASIKSKKSTWAAVEIPECPVCLETMSAPILQCSTGHSLCHNCTNKLYPPTCPICRQPMSQMRNWQLEEMILKAKVPCPNKLAGCVYTMMSMNIEDHIKECIFRTMECPLSVFRRCSWNGALKEMMNHFKERHPTNCNVSSDTEVELDKIDIHEDNRIVYLITQGKLHFILTFKVDTLQKMAYWAIQVIGGKNIALQHVFEIHVTSKKDDRRKVVFIEHCFNDSIKPDEVFRQNKCAVLPLQALDHYILNKKLSFRFFIKRAPLTSKHNKDKHDTTNDNKSSKAERSDSRSRQSGPTANRGPRASSGPRAPRKCNKPSTTR
ncbi:hypothetical protein ACJJTC_003862 [Scirpophaga incertulas]